MKISGEKHTAHPCQVPQKAARATKATSEAPPKVFRDWQSSKSNKDVRSCGMQGLLPRGTHAQSKLLSRTHARSPERAQNIFAFFLT